VTDARRVAFDVLRRVTGDGAYANLALAAALAGSGLDARDRGFVTELVAGTCRGLGVYDLIIERASGRRLKTLQPAVVDLLRLGSHQLLALRTPAAAAVSATVDLTAETVGRRATGVVNAILRRVAGRDLDAWHDLLCEGLDPVAALGVRTHHPAWIAQVYADLLGDEAEAALAANNVAPTTSLALRPTLIEPGPGGRYSPWARAVEGDPGRLPEVQDGRAGVEDEGSQVVALGLLWADAPEGPWLDLCAGPGGKAALLAGLAAQRGTTLVANEPNPARAALVRQNLRAYPSPPEVTECDGRAGPWPDRSFARVLVDAPCTGLGALRRRPEARWRKRAADLQHLVVLQRQLLAAALKLALPGGVVAYATCSPHPAETADIVGAGGATVIPAGQVAPAPLQDAVVGDYLQLWGHRHGTDAMFLALLRAEAPL
jgi:16S rRNA (cytosine967-C5)-methyltransferase